jgi:hypothetical protein
MPNATPATAPIRPSSTASMLIIARSPCRVRPSARSRADSLVRSRTDKDSVLAMPNSAITTDVASRLSNSVAMIPQLGRDYYEIMGIGLVAAFGVSTLTLPSLRRMTAPATIRFE